MAQDLVIPPSPSLFSSSPSKRSPTHTFNIPNTYPGNKRSSSTPDTDTSEFRFGSHSDTAPYSNGTAMGSGSTGGAGYGNKTGEMSGPEPDSLLGKVVEKVGGMVKNDKIEAKGRGMREKEGFGRVVE